METENRIRTLRKKLGLTQADFVAPLEVTREHLSKVERGEDDPGRKMLEAIQMHYQVSLDWLRGRSDDMMLVNRAEEEQQLLNAYRELPDDERQMHRELIRRRADSLRPPKVTKP